MANRPVTAPRKTLPRAPSRTVCHITTVHPVFDSRIFHKECLALVEAGYSVHLVARHDRDEVIQGVRVHALPTPPNRLWRILAWPWLAYRKVLSIRPRPVLVHFHDPELLPVGQALRLCGYRVIYDIHEHVVSSITHKTYLPYAVRVAIAGAYWVAEKFLMSGIAVVTTVGSNARRYRQPCRVVHNYAKLSDTVTLPRAEQRGCPVLIYLGRICEAAGATMMLRIAGELARRGVAFELRLVGGIQEPGLAERMQAIIEEERLHEHVVLTGQLSFDEAMAEAAGADIGLCVFPPTPNNRNSLPRKMMEYLSFGLPVVASDFECWRPYLADTGGGLQVPYGDVGRIADAVQNLIEDAPRREAMGRRARRAVEERFCWEKEKACLWAFYEEILRGRRGGPTCGRAEGAQPGRA